MAKSGGVIQQEKQTDCRFRDYFIGKVGMQIKSTLKSIRFDFLKIFKITRNTSMTSALPAHVNQQDIDQLSTFKIDPNEFNLNKTILGILHLKFNAGMVYYL